MAAEFTTLPRLWLDPIPSVLRATAERQFESGDWLGFLSLADNSASLTLVALNQTALLDRGIYEAALLHALTASRLNNRHWSVRELAALVARADITRLRAAGDPPPETSPLTVFRGVAGRGRARRVRGFSWSRSLPVAAWFARRAGASFGLADPAVYRATVTARDVLAYVNDRREEEVFLMPTARLKPVRYLDGAALTVQAEAEDEARRRTWKVRSVTPAGGESNNTPAASTMRGER